MKQMCIFFLAICIILTSYVKPTNSTKYIAQFYLSKEAKQPQTTFEITKGSYSEIYMSFTLSDPKLYQLKGDLTVSSPFKLSDQISIDTLKERFIPVYLGLSCDEQSASTEYKVQFQIKSQGQIVDNVDIPELTIKINLSQLTLSIYVPLDDITAGSYGIYSIDNVDVLNVDPITIQIEKDQSSRQGTIFNNLSIPAYNNRRILMFIKSTFSTPAITQEEISTEPQKGKVTLRNKCYKPHKDIISFKINTKAFPILNKAAMKDILDSFHEGIPFSSNIPVKMEITTYPVFLYCSIQNQIGSIDTLILQMRNMNAYVKDFNELYYITQSFIANQQHLSLHFMNMNRRIRDYQLLCLIEDTNINQDQRQSIHFTISNDNNADKTLAIHAYPPQPSSCAIWTFSSAYENKKEFETKSLAYCSEYIATYNRGNGNNLLNTDGCLQCTMNHLYYGVYEKPQEAICIRNSITCSTNCDKDLKEIITSMTKAIDTKEKIKEALGLDTPNVELFEVYVDNDLKSDSEKKTNFPLKLVYKGSDTEGEELTIEASNELDRSISCKIKKKALLTIPNDYKYNDYFYDSDYVQLVFKMKETKTLYLAYEDNQSHQGFDNLPYNVFCKCVSIAHEEHNYNDASPLHKVLVVLKTKEQPKEDDLKPKPDCAKTPYVIECLRQIFHEPLPFLNPTPFNPIRPELESYKLLHYPYQIIMLESELTKYEAMQSKYEILIQTVYLGQLLSLTNCSNANDYTKCRAVKTALMARILAKIKSNFTCIGLTKELVRLSTIIPSNILQAALALFYLSTNADSFSKESYGDIFTMTWCMYTSVPGLTKEISIYYFDLVSQKESNGDLLQLLLTTSTNLIEVIHHLEIESVIAQDNESNLFKLDFINQMKLQLMSALTSIMVKTDIKTVEYDNFYYASYNRADYIEKEANDNMNSNKLRGLSTSEPKSLYITQTKMKVTMYPYDFFTQNEKAEFISIFVWKHYPLLPLNSTSYSPNVVSLRAYEYNKEYSLVEMNKTSIDTYPKIRYDYSVQNTTFNDGCFFDDIQNKFVNNHVAYENINETQYAEIKIKSTGDFTLGISLTSYFWLYIVIGVVGVLVLVGGGYFLYYVIKRQRDKSSTVNPLLPE